VEPAPTVRLPALRKALAVVKVAPSWRERLPPAALADWLASEAVLPAYLIGMVLAPTFGDIFRTNALKIGLLPIVLPVEVVETLVHAVVAGGSLTIDLETQQVTGPDGLVVPFEFGAFARESLLQGLDDIALTLKNQGQAVHDWHLLDATDANGKEVKTSLLDPGKSETVDFTITKPGTYHFQCDAHPADMKGTLVVQ